MQFARFNTVISILVCMCIILSALPVRANTTESTFSLIDTSYKNSKDQTVPFNNGAIVGRDITQLDLHFTQDVKEESLTNSVTLTDDQGQDIAVKTSSWAGGLVAVDLTPPLNRNQTYMLSVKGGSSGIKDWQGNSLNTNLNFTFTTEDKPFFQKFGFINPGSTLATYFTAEQGPFQFGATGFDNQPGSTVEFIIEDANTGKPIIDTILTHEGLQNYTFPYTGDYILIEKQKVLGRYGFPMTFGIGANELKVPDYSNLPILNIGDNYFKGLTVMNAPFTVDSYFTSNVNTAKFIQLWLDGKMIKDNILKSDGSLDGPTIDPNSLPDGIHTVTVLAESQDAKGFSTITRHFAVLSHGYIYKDVTPNYWAFTSISEMSFWGILKGVGNHYFAPNNSITRAEFATMLSRTLNLGQEKLGNARYKESYMPTNLQPRFADIPTNYWAEQYIDDLAQKGLMDGEQLNGQTYFYPDRKMTRAEVATVIGKLQNIHPPTSDYGYEDSSEIPQYAFPYVEELSALGFMHGYPDHMFKPLNPISRSEAAQLLSVYLPW